MRRDRRDRGKYRLHTAEQCGAGIPAMPRPGGTPDSSPAFQRRVGWPKGPRPVGTVEKPKAAMELRFRHAYDARVLFSGLPATEGAGYCRRSLGSACVLCGLPIAQLPITSYQLLDVICQLLIATCPIAKCQLLLLGPTLSLSTAFRPPLAPVLLASFFLPSRPGFA